MRSSVHFAYENEKKCHMSNLRSIENVGTTVRIVYSAVSGGTTVERQQSTDIRSTNRNLTLLVLVPNTQREPGLESRQESCNWSVRDPLPVDRI